MDWVRTSRIVPSEWWDESGQEYVYFVFDVDSGLVKIGRANSPASRIRQISSPRLIFLGMVPDGSREKEYHAAFKARCVGKEWFTPNIELMRTINRDRVPNPVVDGFRSVRGDLVEFWKTIRGPLRKLRGAANGLVSVCLPMVSEGRQDLLDSAAGVGEDDGETPFKTQEERDAAWAEYEGLAVLMANDFWDVHRSALSAEAISIEDLVQDARLRMLEIFDNSKIDVSRSHQEKVAYIRVSIYRYLRDTYKDTISGKFMEVWPEIAENIVQNAPITTMFKGVDLNSVSFSEGELTVCRLLMKGERFNEACRLAGFDTATKRKLMRERLQSKLKKEWEGRG